MKDKLLKLAKENNIDLEIYTTSNNELTIETLNEKLVNYNNQNITTYEIKAIIDGSSSILTTETLENPEQIIKLLKEQSIIKEEKIANSVADKETVENTNRSIKSVDVKKIIKNLKSLVVLKEQYREVFSIRSTYNYELDNYELVNTNGSNLKDTNYHEYYAADITIKTNNQSSTTYEYIIAKDVDYQSFKEKVIKGIEKTIRKNSSSSIKTSKYNIVLNNECVYSLLKSFAADLFANKIYAKESPFIDKLNKKIFSPLINIVEDPTNQQLVGSTMFDREGIKTYKKDVIKNGILKNYFYNKKYATIYKTKPTGNSGGVRNLYLVPGKNSKEELFNNVKNGIYIDEIMGLHSGINHLTGEISLQCNGFKIEDGKLTDAINEIIFATDIFELFNNVKEIGNDLEFFGSFGGAPSILVKDISIIGKEV